MTTAGAWEHSTLMAEAQTPQGDGQGSNFTYFQDAFHQYIQPILEANPQLGTMMTIAAIVIICVKMFTIFSSYRKSGFSGWMLPLIVTSLITAMLIAPSTLLPIWLGIIDGIWGLILSIIEGTFALLMTGGL
ncbi:hypothetical protein [Enteractinococcus helveticum]|uniref:Uncharacterized protein n=1 Tax=Enteractinococcus helveticum TaxID=1837282 RepID=A0A1B7M2P7_9MICC|nr:hypothetical protein [Enteractinococcus helveticum]OAV62835.1 hypothetical protein A6F49_04835 [Enteractinococcus helveticum]